MGGILKLLAVIPWHVCLEKQGNAVCGEPRLEQSSRMNSSVSIPKTDPQPSKVSGRACKMGVRPSRHRPGEGQQLTQGHPAS